MAEGNLATESGILIAGKRPPEKIDVQGRKLPVGWERSDLNLIVPNNEVKIVNHEGVLRSVGFNNFSEETKGSPVAKAVTKLVTDPGDFRVGGEANKTQKETLSSDLTKVARAIHSPGQYITNSLESHGESEAFQSERVTKDIFWRVQKEKIYFDKNTGKNEKMVFSAPGLMEKYLVEAVKCVGDQNIANSEAPKSLSSHASELLKKTRLDMEIEVVPEMPSLVEAVIFCLADKNIKFDKETRGNLYNILEQVTIPNSFLEELAQVMEKKGDLGHDLALKVFFELRKKKPDCDFLKHQKERRTELLSVLSGTPQGIYDNYAEISEMAMGLVVGVDMDNLTNAKIGIEIEYKPDLKMTPKGNIPDRFTAGIDAGEVVEIRTNDEKLGFDEKYMESLYLLETWLGDQPKEKLATLHVHLDTEIHPKVRKLMEGMSYQIKDNLGTEIWGMGLPSNANGLINLLNFFAIGSKEKFEADQNINISDTDSVNWSSLVGGYYCSRLTEPESRLAVILGMRGEKNSVLFNPLEIFKPLEILQRYNFSSLEGIERLEAGLSEKQSDIFKIFVNAEMTGRLENLTQFETKSLIYSEMLDGNNEDNRRYALEMLRDQKNLPKKTVDSLTDMLADSDENISHYAVTVLHNQDKLPDETVYKLIEMVVDRNGNNSYVAHRVLRNQRNLSGETIDKLIGMVGDSNRNISNYFFEVLRNQDKLPEKTIDKLIGMVDDSSVEIRDWVFAVLQNQENLPRDTIDKVTEMLSNSDENIGNNAYRVLRDQKNLPEETIFRLTEMLGEANENIRYSAFGLLQYQKILPKETLDKVTELLGDRNGNNSIYANGVLRNQDKLPKETLDKVTELLGDSNINTRDSALGVLQGQENLPEKTIVEVTEMLKDSSGNISESASGVLQVQNNLPEETIVKITEMLKDSSGNISKNAYRVLQVQNNLPEKTIVKITEMLSASNEDIRYYASEVLQNQDVLPRETVDWLTEMVVDRNGNNSYVAHRVLRSQKNLPKETIDKVTDMLSNGNKNISNSAYRVLQSQKNLPRETIAKVTEMLGNSNGNISNNACEVLQIQKNLPEETIVKITEMLDDSNKNIRNNVFEVLRYQDNLPKETIAKVTEMLGVRNGNDSFNAERVLRSQEYLLKETSKKMIDLIRRKKIVLDPDLVSLCIRPLKH